jgi:hypothetical protein
VPDWLRRAGHGRAPDGSLVTWSVAEGRSGRRWREVVTTGEAIRSSLLLELDPGGRFSHLELSTPAGLLTLHPEGDGTLHGNAVTADGVHHVAGLPWDADGSIVVEGSAVCVAVTRGRRAIAIGLDLALREVDGLAPPGDVDRTGLPALDDDETWPLELEV